MWITQTNLILIDLSYNYLTTINDEITKFPNLQNLYLPYIYIKDLGETKKLNIIKVLKSLNMFGNPINQVSNYRMWVLAFFMRVMTILRNLTRSM